MRPESRELCLRCWEVSSQASTVSAGRESSYTRLRTESAVSVVPRKASCPELRSATPNELGLAREGLRWYQATRHTFASQWVMNGGSIEKLKEILGHYAVVITERYAHLRPHLFTARDLATIDVSLSASDASPGALAPENGHEMGTVEPVPFRIRLKSRRKTGAAL